MNLALAEINAAAARKDAEPPPAPVTPPPSEVPPAAKPAPVAEAAPAAPDAPPAEAAQPVGDPRAALAALAQGGNTNRLSPADEDRATKLMHGCLVEGGDGISTALAAMPHLPWILGVRAIENAWKDLPAESRAAVLDGLAKMDTDNGFRLRLSMARSLARVEPPEGVKVAAATCRSMWNAETGTLKPEHSKLIGNVFIGRGKPWVLQLALADLPEEDAKAILSAVVFSTFNVNNAPITQLSVLRYAGARLGSLHENLIGMVARAVGRWSGKWQSALRKEVAELPEAVASALKPERGSEQAEASADTAAAPAEEVEAPLPAELQEKLRAAAESEDPAAVEAVNQEIAAWREAEKIARLEAIDAESEDEDEDEDEDDDDSDAGTEPAAEEGGGRRKRGRKERKERPAYISREQERGQSGGNFGAILKQLESYVSSLRNELSTAQNRLRRAENEGAKARADRPILSHEEANLSPDELKRLVIQLEARVAELNARVEELTTDSEARALAMSVGTDTTPDAVTQLRTLLALKLQEDYADFLALQKESPDAIVQQHYRALINHVFEVLLGEQIPLTVPSENVAPPPLPPSVPH